MNYFQIYLFKISIITLTKYYLFSKRFSDFEEKIKRKKIPLLSNYDNFDKNSNNGSNNNNNNNNQIINNNFNNINKIIKLEESKNINNSNEY